MSAGLLDTSVVVDLRRYVDQPEVLPEQACVSSCQSIAAATLQAGRHPRRRTLDLLIAATAQAHGLPLYTQNVGDVEHLADLVTVVGV